MKKVELIIEGVLNPKDENLICSIARIKYKLPIINSFVIEIDENNIDKLKNILNIKTFLENTHITMQMDTARKTVKADFEHNYTGKDIGIAILDTGIDLLEDFTKPRNRIIAFKDFINNRARPYDDNGHGTHVSGICGGNGFKSNGKYKGIAINSNLIGVKILNEDGKGNAFDVLAGIQWVLNNKNKYNIKILNLSIGTTATSSNDPLVKAVEGAWDNGLIVTIAAGNAGPKSGSISSPAISKKVITIGSSDDSNKSMIAGNTLVNFSGRGPTLDCVIKPDILAPGVSITSCMSKGAKDDKLNILDNYYFSLSGTSMSTPIVTGAIALLLEKHKNLKPDDVKLMLKKCCTPLNLPRTQQGWGLINVSKLLSQEVSYAR